MEDVTGKPYFIDTGKLVFLDFHAKWCNPCRAESKVLERVEKEFTNIKFGKVDIDKDPEAVKTYRIHSVPTLILFFNGQVVKRWVGFHTYEEIVKVLGKWLDVGTVGKTS